MKRILPLVVTLSIATLFLLTVPQVHAWPYRQHLLDLWEVPYDALPGAYRDRLKRELVAKGSTAPDDWRYGGGENFHPAHILDNVPREDSALAAFKFYTRAARDNLAAGAWDNGAYLLGVAGHYVEGLTVMNHYVQTSEYLERIYGTELGYKYWDERHDFEDHQIYFYEPRPPWRIDGYSHWENFLENFIGGVPTDFGVSGNTYVENWLRRIHWEPPQAQARPLVHLPSADNVWMRWWEQADCELVKQHLDMHVLLVYNTWMRVLENVWPGLGLAGASGGASAGAPSLVLLSLIGVAWPTTVHLCAQPKRSTKKN